jgi:hypothetical protein
MTGTRAQVLLPEAHKLVREVQLLRAKDFKASRFALVHALAQG